MAEPARLAAPCVFCEILASRAPASFVYRDAVCAAFLDIQPVNPGHLLVVPLIHAAGLADLEADTSAHLFRVAQRLAQAVRGSGVRSEGINLLVADGAAAGQDVFHIHLHVVPRFEQDGFGFRYSPAYFHKPERAELETIAEQIRSVL